MMQFVFQIIGKNEISFLELLERMKLVFLNFCRVRNVHCVHNSKLNTYQITVLKLTVNSIVFFPILKLLIEFEYFSEFNFPSNKFSVSHPNLSGRQTLPV